MIVMEVTESNTLEASFFMDGEVWTINGKNRACLRTVEGGRITHPGDRIFKAKNGAISIIDAELYSLIYK